MLSEKLQIRLNAQIWWYCTRAAKKLGDFETSYLGSLVLMLPYYRLPAQIPTGRGATLVTYPKGALISSTQSVKTSEEWKLGHEAVRDIGVDCCAANASLMSS